MFNKLWQWFWQQRADYFFYKNKGENRLYNYMYCIDVKFRKGDYWKRQWIKLLFNKDVI